MITLTIDQFIKRLATEQWRDITFYEGYIANPKDQQHFFFRIKNPDSNENANVARGFLEEYQGLWTVKARKQENGGSEPPVVLQVDSRSYGGSHAGQFGGQYRGGSQSMNGFGAAAAGHGAPFPSYEQMYQKALADLKLQMEMDYLKKKIESQDEELKYQKSTAGKIGAVGGEIFWTWMKKNPKWKSAMQGFDEFKDVTEEEEKKQEQNQNMSDAQKKELSEALDIMLKILGPEKFIKIAKILKEDPSKADLLKAFL